MPLNATSTARQVADPALGWSRRLRVEVGGAGTLAQAGVVLPRLWADRLGLTTGLARVVARAGFWPVCHRGRLLVDATCALAAGATCLSGIEAMTAQEDHRTQAHVEDRVKQLEACGARNLPSIDYHRNSAWLQLAALATSLTARLRHLAFDGERAKASTKILRFRVFSAPARLATHARGRILKIPPGWAWSPELATAGERLQALHPA